MATDRTRYDTTLGVAMTRTGLIRIFGCLALVIALQPCAQAATGRTAGSAAVSSTGAATYHVPIWLPAGPHGLQPTLSLDYNSQGGNGIAGMGWALSGLTAITRCNKTVAQDSASIPVWLQVSDGYCLNGNRLRLTSSGNYGMSGSTYQTEIADFSQITANGTAGNGPQYFEVQGKDGNTYEYGYTTDSRVLVNSSNNTPYQWLLDKVTDKYGNTYTVSYGSGASGSSGIAVPLTISYTPSAHGSSSYNYTVIFAYVARNSINSSTTFPAIYSFFSGYQLTNTNLLNTITVQYQGSTVKKYNLTYASGPATSRARLTQILECADDAGTNCLSPTTVAYPTTSAGVSSSPGVSQAVASLGTAQFDFNGDGRNDIAYQSGGYWYVMFATNTGFGSGISTGIAATATVQFVRPAVGNSSAGLLNLQSGVWKYTSWNPSSNTFTTTSTGANGQPSNLATTLLLDTDGDGLRDLVTESTAGSGVINVQHNTGTATQPTFSSTVTSTFMPAVCHGNSNYESMYGGSPNTFDLNSDGQEDLVAWCYNVQTYQNYSFYGFASGTTFGMYSMPQNSLYSAATVAAMTQTNDDGCGDAWVFGYAYLSNCGLTTAVNISYPGASLPVLLMDWNGDGRTDAVVNNGGTLGVYLSTGTGFGSLITTSIPYNSTMFVTDEDGDGLDDIGYTQSGTLYFLMHNSSLAQPDLATSIVDGYGNSATFTYVSTTRSNYTKGSSASAPDEDIQPAMYVVSQVTLTDGTGGTYNQTFSYAGAQLDGTGRGFLGFQSRTMTDSRNGLVETTTWDLQFPFTRMVLEDDIFQPNGTTPISQTTNTPVNLLGATITNAPNNARYFPYFTTSVVKRSEVAGARIGQVMSTLTTIYTYDAYGNATIVDSTLKDNDLNSPFSAQTWTSKTTTSITPDTSGNWCLNLPTQIQIINQSPSDPSPIPRTTTFPSPDYAHCRELSKVTESGSSYALTEAYTYDAFGNLSIDQISGVGVASRTTTITWGSAGQFPMYVQDPLLAVTNLNYDFHYGLLSSLQDPNLLTTSWQYDAFGRKNLETRPDGTTTTWAYSLYSGSDASTRLTVTEQPRDTSNTVISTTTYYSDMQDRPRSQLSTLLDGTTSWTMAKQYDQFGNVHYDYFPYRNGSTNNGFTTNTYDVLNRLTKSQRPINAAPGSALQATSISYAGDTVSTQDAMQQNTSLSTTKIYTPLGQVGRTVDALGYYVTLSYDGFGSATGAIDSLGNILFTNTYKYGSGAFRTASTNLDRGNWTYSYDALGNLIGWTDAKLQTFSATYDSLSRLVTRDEPDHFTQWTWGSSQSSHNIGKLQAVCSGYDGIHRGNCSSTPDYSEADSYDTLGRLSQRSISTFEYYGSPVTQTYSATTGLPDRLTYPASTNGCQLIVQSGYAYGILASLTDVSNATHCGSTGTVFWTANSTDAAGQITQETLGNGIVTSRQFDAVTSWLTSVTAGMGGGSAIQNQGWLYDRVGNVTERQDNNRLLTENAWYDEDYRLTSTQLNSTPNLTIAYDPMGNITSRSDVAGGGIWTYDPVHKHQVTQIGSSSFAYDPNGNETNNGGKGSYGWWSSNYPDYVFTTPPYESELFVYGPDHQRVMKGYTTATDYITTDYIGGILEVVYDTNTYATDYRHYIYAGSEPVAVYSRKNSGLNKVSYFQSDQQGSVAGITNSAGGTDVNESFTPSGARRNPATWSGAASDSDLTASDALSDQGYTFQTQIGLWMGLNHMNGRVQDALLGRFLSPDPYIQDPSLTQDYNPYSYTRNNPMSGTDPTGFDLQEVPVIGLYFYPTFSRGNLFWFCQYFACTSYQSPPAGSPGPTTQTPAQPAPKKNATSPCDATASGNSGNPGTTGGSGSNGNAGFANDTGSSGDSGSSGESGSAKIQKILDATATALGLTSVGTGYTANTLVSALQKFSGYLGYGASTADGAAAGYAMINGDMRTFGFKATDFFVTAVATTAAPGLVGRVAVAVYTGAGGSEFAVKSGLAGMFVAMIPGGLFLASAVPTVIDRFEGLGGPTACPKQQK